MNSRLFIGMAAVLLSAMSYAAVNAGDGHFNFASGEQPAALLELYTSEGCSSCPPADAWLSRLKDSPRLWTEVVPVAFHVDYWDHLGWRDPWGSFDFSERQRRYAESWRSTSIYTPGFVLGGREWRGWISREQPKTASGSPAGVLRADSTDGKIWNVRFTPAGRNGRSFEAHAALLGSGLVSEVKRGENAGRKLQHDFVVLHFAKAALTNREDSWDGQIAFPNNASPTSTRLALAVWITEKGRLEPVQATGGWLKP